MPMLVEKLRRFGPALIFFAIAIPSCGGPSGQVAVYPARGQVLFQGKPLAHVLVSLEPIEPAKAEAPPRPIGETDQDGRFQLRTYLGNDGAPAGSYRVAVTIAKTFQENNSLSTKFVKPPEPANIDYRYRNAASSGLKIEIQPGNNELAPIDLK